MVEVISGSAEHERVLNLYPTASHYGPDHEVIPGPPVLIDLPYVGQASGELTCTMGNWSNEPTAYSYQWVMDGSVAIGDGTEVYVATPEDVGHSVCCYVTATNDAGGTMAPASNSVVVE